MPELITGERGMVIRPRVLKSKEQQHTWQTNPEPITFPDGKTWKDYVRLTRMEITCGEAPYQNIYGYEWQGDNLLLAREALLYTFIVSFLLRILKAIHMVHLHSKPAVLRVPIVHSLSLNYDGGADLPDTC